MALVRTKLEYACSSRKVLTSADVERSAPGIVNVLGPIFVVPVAKLCIIRQFLRKITSIPDLFR